MPRAGAGVVPRGSAHQGTGDVSGPGHQKGRAGAFWAGESGVVGPGLALLGKPLLRSSGWDLPALGPCSPAPVHTLHPLRPRDRSQGPGRGHRPWGLRRLGAQRLGAQRGGGSESWGSESWGLRELGWGLGRDGLLHERPALLQAMKRAWEAVWGLSARLWGHRRRGRRHCPLWPGPLCSSPWSCSLHWK